LFRFSDKVYGLKNSSQEMKAINFWSFVSSALWIHLVFGQTDDGIEDTFYSCDKEVSTSVGGKCYSILLIRLQKI